MSENTDSKPEESTAVRFTPENLKEQFDLEFADDYPVEYWDDAIELFKNRSGDFFTEYESGHPRTLLSLSSEIKTMLKEIRSGPNWEKFRKVIEEKVNKTSAIQHAVCLGLGRLVHKRSSPVENIWLYQYTVFLFICGFIDEKQKKECEDEGKEWTPITRIYQDPDFDVRTKYLIGKIHPDQDQETVLVVEHPQASFFIHESTFLYGIHLPAVMWDDILQADRVPQLIIGNDCRLQGGFTRALMDRFIEDVFSNGSLENTPKFQSLLMRMGRVNRTYDQTAFPTIDSLSEDVFSTTTIYQRREIKPAQVEEVNDSDPEPDWDSDGEEFVELDEEGRPIFEGPNDSDGLDPDKHKWSLSWRAFCREVRWAKRQVRQNPMFLQTREDIAKAVDEGPRIETAICCGLGACHGSIDPTGLARFYGELGFFLKIVHYIQKKQGGTPIKMFVQEPSLNDQDREYLKRIKIELIDTPKDKNYLDGAVGKMGENTFVMALNCPEPIAQSLAERKPPGIFISIPVERQAEKNLGRGFDRRRFEEGFSEFQQSGRGRIELSDARSSREIMVHLPNRLNDVLTWQRRSNEVTDGGDPSKSDTAQAESGQ